MGIRRGLGYKKEIVTVAILSIVLLIISFKFIYRNIVNYVNLQTEEKIIKVSEMLAGQIDGDSHEEFVKGGSSIENAFSKEINSLLLEAKEKFPEMVDIYTIFQTKDPNVWKVALTTDMHVQDKISQGKRRDLIGSEIYKVYLGSISDENFVYKEKGNLVSVYKPIYNNSGKRVAILGIDVKESRTVEWVRGLLYKAEIFMIVIILILSLVCLGVVDKILKLIGLLVEESKGIKQGKKLYLSEDLDGKLGLLVKEINQVLQQNQYEKEVQEVLINRIREEKENIFEVYRDVIEAVTQNKVLLLSKEAFIEKVYDDFPLYSAKLTTSQDITRCRREIDNTLTAKNFPWWDGKNRRNILLCISEAITNVIKHAGSGEVLLSAKDCMLTIYILDNGEGIDLKKLPYTIFISGFSTKQTSLGSGFLLMEKYMDKVILSTSKEGTFLALQKQICVENQI